MLERLWRKGNPSALLVGLQTGATTVENSMDRTGKHYAKLKKPSGERQIPYDLTFNRNLINKTNKQAKYNQIHCN